MISQNHKRVITVGLYVLEKSLERIEETLTSAQDRERITYEVNDRLNDEVRNAVLQNIEKMRKIIKDLKDELKLQLQEEPIANKIKAEAAHIWQMLCDMRSGGLDRYGKTAKDLSDFLDPKVEELLEIILRIQYLMEAESNKLER